MPSKNRKKKQYNKQYYSRKKSTSSSAVDVKPNAPSFIEIEPFALDVEPNAPSLREIERFALDVEPNAPSLTEIEPFALDVEPNTPSLTEIEPFALDVEPNAPSLMEIEPFALDVEPNAPSLREIEPFALDGEPNAPSLTEIEPFALDVEPNAQLLIKIQPFAPSLSLDVEPNAPSSLDVEFTIEPSAPPAKGVVTIEPSSPPPKKRRKFSTNDDGNVAIKLHSDENDELRRSKRQRTKNIFFKMNELGNEQIRLFPTPVHNREKQYDISNLQKKSSVNITCKLNLSNKIPDIELHKIALAEKMKTDLIGEGSTIHTRIQAENVIKWVLEVRKQLTKSLRYQILKLKGQIKPLLTRCNAIAEAEEKYKIITGVNLHTCSSEPYFLEPTYILPTNGIANKMVIDESGKVYNIFPYNNNENPTKKWHCNPNVCNVSNFHGISSRLQSIDQKLTAEKPYDCLKYTVTEIDSCVDEDIHKETHLGHASTCHTKNYGSTDLLFLLNLRPHYPLIRSISSTIYSIRQNNLKLNTISDALKNSDIFVLNEYAEHYKSKGLQFTIHSTKYSNENEIMKEYEKGFSAMYKYESDVPIHSCMSCECLKRSNDLSVICRLKKPIECAPWKALLEMVKYHKLPNEYICKYCLGYFRRGEMPPTCLMNNLFVNETPKEIQTLNQYEKLLIQRAKAFQIVVKMGTVSGQNKPTSVLNTKVVGRTFHLPLPVQQSLQKLPKPGQCLIPNQELYIMVRGMPTNQRKMWESLVSVTKVYKALLWLKSNNHLYKDIVLPPIPDDLLNELTNHQTRVTYRLSDNRENTQCSNSEDEDLQSAPHSNDNQPTMNTDNNMEATPQQHSTTIANVTLPHGFFNPGNACYANSVCQSLCSFDCVIENLRYIEVEGIDHDAKKNENVFKQFSKIIYEHEDPNTRINYSTDLRMALGHPFNDDNQQDAEEFYNALLKHCVTLQNLTKIEKISTKTCMNEQCNYVMVTSEGVDFIFRVPLNSSFDINETVSSALPNVSNLQCPSCDANNCNQVFEIGNIPEILVFQLGIYEMDGTKIQHQRTIKNLYDRDLLINGHTYKLRSVIYHQGTNIFAGHYTTAIKRERSPWILTSDLDVQIFSPLQHRGDPYLLFYQLQPEPIVDVRTVENVLNLESNEVAHGTPNLQFNELVGEGMLTNNIENSGSLQHDEVMGENDCPNADFENIRSTTAHDNLHTTNDTHEAMLTQKDPHDEFYQHYTIYQLNETRVNKDAAELYQLLRVQSSMIDNRDLELDVKCFPDLYPDGINGMSTKRLVYLSAFEFSKLRMKSRCNAFRLNIQYLFFLLGLTNIRQLASGIYHKLSSSSDKMTASDYLEKMKNRELDESLCNVFAKLRNTAQYWFGPRQDVYTMINNYGPATFFLTLSPSEYDWTDLDAYLRKMNPDQCKGKSTSMLIAMDPVSTSRFVDIKFQAVMKYIDSENGPLGTIKHYFWRREYQSRGMQHFHILLWAENSPVIGESSNADVAEFIAKYVTCALNNYRRSIISKIQKHLLAQTLKV